MGDISEFVSVPLHINSVTLGKSLTLYRAPVYLFIKYRQ